MGPLAFQTVAFDRPSVRAADEPERWTYRVHRHPLRMPADTYNGGK
jgi:hypothetical protein